MRSFRNLHCGHGVLQLAAHTRRPYHCSLACCLPLWSGNRHKAERNAETQSYLVEVVSGIQTVKAQTLNYNRLAVARALCPLTSVLVLIAC